MTTQILTDKDIYDILHKKYICLPNDGLLLKKSNKKVVGSLSGNGYVLTDFNGKKEGVHRLIYCMVYGHMPNEIDHLNHNQSDNRISNLRDGTHAENLRNRSIGKNNKSGITGVWFNENTNRWIATIKHNGQYLYLGSFKNFINAVKARAYTEKKLGYEEYDFLTTASIYLFRLDNMIFKTNVVLTEDKNTKGSVDTEWEFFTLSRKQKIDKFIQEQTEQHIKEDKLKEQTDLTEIQELNKQLLNK